jgi:hypothetical protein
MATAVLRHAAPDLVDRSRARTAAPAQEEAEEGEGLTMASVTDDPLAQDEKHDLKLTRENYTR